MARHKKGDQSRQDLYSEENVIESGSIVFEPVDSKESRHASDIKDLFQLFQESDERRRREDCSGRTEEKRRKGERGRELEEQRLAELEKKRQLEEKRHLH